MGAGYSMKARAEEADIYIYEDVGSGWFGGVSAKQFATDLKALGAVTTINLHINSYGGEVFEGVAIYRQLASHPARVVAHIDGVAASIASVIAMAADEILITEAGFIMIHDASGGCFGRAEEMRQIADLLDTITSTIAEVYVARTGMAAHDVRELMAAETWLGAAEAVEKGFATSVVENLRLAASGDPKALFAASPRPSLVAASKFLQAAREAMPDLPGGVPPVEATPPAAPRSNVSPMAARVALQRAQLAAHRPPQPSA